MKIIDQFKEWIVRVARATAEQDVMEARIALEAAEDRLEQLLQEGNVERPINRKAIK